MKTLKKFLLPVVLAGCASTIPGFGQGLQATGYEPNGDPYFERTGDDLPKYIVVRKFFEAVEICREVPRAYSMLLGNLGIVEGSTAEQLLLSATVDAQDPKINKRPDLRPLLDDPIAFEKVQQAALRNRVLHLARVYYRLVDNLEKEGGSRVDVDSTVEQMREAVVLISTPTPEYEIFEIMAEFEVFETKGGRQ